MIKETKEERQSSLSSPSKIIIQSSDQSYTFTKNTYREEYLKHCISKDHYEAIVKEASKIMGQSWSKKRLNDQIKLPPMVIVLSVVAAILAVAYMILIYLAATSESGETLLVAGILCVSVGSAIAFGLSIYNFFRKVGRFKSLQEIMTEDIDKYLSSVNERYMGNLNFAFDSNKRWIEIHIKKPYVEGDRAEKQQFLPERVEEEPDNEDQAHKDESPSKEKKHQRIQSHNIGEPKSKTPPINMKASTLHSRAQSSIINRKDAGEIELGKIRKI